MLYSKKNKNNKKNNNNVNDVNVGFFLFLYIKIWNNDWRLQYWNTSSKKKKSREHLFSKQYYSTSFNPVPTQPVT